MHKVNFDFFPHSPSHPNIIKLLSESFTFLPFCQYCARIWERIFILNLVWNQISMDLPDSIECIVLESTWILSGKRKPIQGMFILWAECSMKKLIIIRYLQIMWVGISLKFGFSWSAKISEKEKNCGWAVETELFCGIIAG